MLTAAALVLLGYALGSLPFSVWLVRWSRHADVRAFGDGNPGAANAWGLAGWRLGVVILVLDVLKAAAAPALAVYVFGVPAWGLVAVALAPIVGHITSPWLGFRGGKGIASTFGVWAVLTLWLVPTTFGLSLALLLCVQSERAWTVILAWLAGLVVLAAVRPEPALLAASVANGLLLAWTHRSGLRRVPRFHAPFGSPIR